MSKIIRTRKPSVLPFYAMALVFLVLCAVLPVYKLWALLAALGGAFVAFGAAQKVCPPRVVEHEVPFHTGSGDVDEMLADIQQKLDALHALNEALPDPELSAAMTRMEKAGRSIMETVEASPAKAKQVRHGRTLGFWVRITLLMHFLLSRRGAPPLVLFHNKSFYPQNASVS